jgi:hypothetical protein
MEETKEAQAGQEPKRSKEAILAAIGVDSLRPRQDPFQAALEAKYTAECEKARKRAERFGVEYKAPDKAVLFAAETKRAQRMRQDEGFYVTIDLESEAERAKQQARGERWGHSETYVKAKDDAEEAAKKAERAARFNLPTAQAVGGILRKMGLNPRYMYLADATRRDPGRQASSTWGQGGDNALPGSIGDKDGAGLSLSRGLVSPPEERLEETKVHVHALDKECFRAMRSGDVLRFFNEFFPRCRCWEGKGWGKGQARGPALSVSPSLPPSLPLSLPPSLPPSFPPSLLPLFSSYLCRRGVAGGYGGECDI